MFTKHMGFRVTSDAFGHVGATTTCLKLARRNELRGLSRSGRTLGMTEPICDFFDWTGYGRAELQPVRFGQERMVWVVPGGPRLIRYHASSWQAQYKTITTRRFATMEAALEEFRKKAQQ